MSTKSEELFEAFLTSNGVAFSRIEEAKETGAKRADREERLGDAGLGFDDCAREKRDGTPLDACNRLPCCHGLGARKD